MQAGDIIEIVAGRAECEVCDMFYKDDAISTADLARVIAENLDRPRG